MTFACFSDIGLSARLRRSRRRQGRRHRGGAMLALAIIGGGIVAQSAFAQGVSKSATPSGLDLQKDPTLYVVGYSHLDTEWCWSYPQVIREFIPNTLHENFALFDKYPDYIFNWTGANRYRFMKDYYPDDYAKLKKYVATGKWYPNGSSIEEGDVNNPSSESLIRQVLYGNQFFRREFGVASNEYMLPDCFGFPASLPSILAHCGITGFSTQKLTWGSAVGIPFNVGVWNGPDGQGVVAALNPGSYTSRVTDDLSHDKDWETRLAKDRQTSHLSADYAYYGVGDRGGAPDTDSVANVEKSLSAGGPVHVVSSRASDMFSAITPDERARLLRYSGDLLLTQHSAGSLTSQTVMKRWNRKNELLADSAERASVAATFLGAEVYPSARLTDAWWRFLPGQFHDLLAGTALPKSYEFTQNDEVIASNEFAGVLAEGAGGVIRAMDTTGDSGAGEAHLQANETVVVYNTLSVGRTDVVDATVPFRPTTVQGGFAETVIVTGPGGEIVPAQLGNHDVATAHVLFLATPPPVGFAAYHIGFVLRPRATAAEDSSLKVTENSLENARYRIRLDANGDVSSLFDKTASKEMLSAPARLAFVTENPSQYPAWNMDWADQAKPPRAYVDGPATVKIVENGPARVALEVTRQAQGSTFVQTIRLASGEAGNRVEFATKVDWRSSESVLKAVFPLTVSNERATYNWGIGTVERATNDPKKYEVPGHQWFDLTDTGGKYGVSVLEDCKDGSDKPDDHTLRLSLIYTPGVRAGYHHQATQDWGRNEFVYALEGHVGDWRQGNTQWEAARLNQPLIAFNAKAHEGPLGASFSLLQVSDPQVQVEALKKAEDSGEIIVRMNELAGQAARKVHLKFATSIVAAREVNGQEQPIAGVFEIRKGELVFDMDPYRPRAFAVKLAPAPASLVAPSSTLVALPYDTNVKRAPTGAGAAAAFDADGRTIPAEMLPATLDSGGVTFSLASPTSVNNAVTCRGQVIALPSVGGRPENRHLYLLAAAYGGDVSAPFQIDDAAPVNLTIQDWNGYVGQWDTRLWGGEVPELTYGMTNPMIGITPGYVKLAPVAWYSDHRRLADGANDPYQFCYLFRYAIDLPSTARILTLPRNEKIRILAASIADNSNESATPAEPLFDTLADHQGAGDAPLIAPSSGHFTNSVPVSLRMPLYYSGKTDLHYTLDGTDPTPASPVFKEDFLVSKPTTIKVGAVNTEGAIGPIASARLDVDDKTPPSVLSVSVTSLTTMKVVFSEPVTRETAENIKNYEVKSGTEVAIPTIALSAEPQQVVMAPPGTIITRETSEGVGPRVVKAPSPVAVTAATLDADSRSVTLTLASAILPNASGDVSLQVHGVADQSPAANAIAATTVKAQALAPVVAFISPPVFTGSGRGVTIGKQTSLPTKAADSWTINMYVYADKQPDELTILGGFGDAEDNGGAERYIIKFHDGIHFWGSGVDITSGVPLDLGKWQMLTATFDGRTLRLYKNGTEIKSDDASFMDAEPVVRLGVHGPWDNSGHFFTGKIAGFTIWKTALQPDFLKTLLASVPVTP